VKGLRRTLDNGGATLPTDRLSRVVLGTVGKRDEELGQGSAFPAKCLQPTLQVAPVLGSRETLKHAHDRNMGLLALADAQGATLPAFVATAAGVLAIQPDPLTVRGALFSGLPVTLDLAVLAPRLSIRSRSSRVYFGHIPSTPSGTKLRRGLRAACFTTGSLRPYKARR